MSKLLVRLFIKDYKNVQDETVRGRYGNLAGAVSIIINIVLSAGKIAAGLIFGVISVLADGLNNLTDCGSNVVSLISFRLAGKPADKKHPYGHQRIEYVASMIVAFIVLVLAVELMVESLKKIITPQESVFDTVMIVVLCVSIAAKLWMFFFNRSLGKAINSGVLKATSVDSLTDCIATTAVLIALIISHFTGVNLDGYMGCVVAVVIAFAGVGILKDTLNKLLGEAPDKEMVEGIRARIMSHEGVHSVHDLMVHNYGHSKYYASVHVEIDANMPMMEGHDLADRIERDFACNTNIVLVVHIDPVVLDNPKCNKYRDMVEEMVRQIDPSYSIHDFRMVDGVSHTNLIFDVAIPFDSKLSEEEVKDAIAEKVHGSDESLYAVATVEKQIQG